MNSLIILYSCFILLGTLISSISQVILKKAALKKYPSKIKEYLNFPVMFAYTLFFASTLLTIVAYKVVPLSFGPVLEATNYIYVTAFGVLIFKEKLTTKKVIALVLIVCGIVIYAFGING